MRIPGCCLTFIGRSSRTQMPRSRTVASRGSEAKQPILGRLARIFRGIMAVYTDVSFEDLEGLLSGYDIGAPRSFKGIAEGVENSNFLLQTDRAAFILTLYEKRVSASDLPFFLGLMDHLASRGVACPLPVRSRSGAQWTTLNGRPAAILTFLDGLSLRRPEPPHCAAAGAALAGLHDAGAGFALRRPNALSIAGWRTLADTT